MIKVILESDEIKYFFIYLWILSWYSIITFVSFLGIEQLTKLELLFSIISSFLTTVMFLLIILIITNLFKLLEVFKK